MSSSLFWDVTQFRFVVSYDVAGQPIGLVFKDEAANNLRCVTSQKSEDLKVRIFNKPLVSFDALQPSKLLPTFRRKIR